MAGFLLLQQCLKYTPQILIFIVKAVLATKYKEHWEHVSFSCSSVQISCISGLVCSRVQCGLPSLVLWLGMFRKSKLSRLSGEGSELSLSQDSSRSKSQSLDSSEDLSKSSTLSSPEANSKRAESFSSARSLLSDTNETDFPVRIVGCLENVAGGGGGPLDVINLIDVAQQENELPFTPHNEEAILSLTLHGIKLTKTSNNVVLYRIPLHHIERIVIFDDGLVGNTMLAVKCAGHSMDYMDRGNCFNIHAYQCESKEIAQEVCRNFSHILDTAIGSTSPSKAQWLEMNG